MIKGDFSSLSYFSWGMGQIQGYLWANNLMQRVLLQCNNTFFSLTKQQKMYANNL